MLLNRFFRYLFSFLLFIATSTQVFGVGQSIYDCSCLLASECAAAFESTESLLHQAQANSNSSINELGRSIFENIENLEHGIAHPFRETFRWELGQMLLNLHELISFQSIGISERELTDLAQTYIRQLNANSARYLAQPQTPLIEAPLLPGAEFLPVLEGERTPSQLNIFVVQGTHGFTRWTESLGGEVKRAIQRRLSTISSTGHMGDVGVTQSEIHQSAATIYEMRLHIASGPRIYFMHVNSGIVILGYNLKSEGKGSQSRAIRRAGELADAFLILN